jgi:vitamin B12/bleomycin/antimicrobial peptide transport system ATP-binding/permease protein
LFWVALLYAACGSGLAHWLGHGLIPLHFQQQKTEADFRFSLMRLNECAEGVAFHGGEAEQQRELTGRFGSLAANWRAIMVVTKRLTFLTVGYAQVALVFPLAVTAPAYFAGRIPLGGIFQASNAFVQVQGALSWMVDNYAVLTDWLATVNRLASFRRAMAEAGRVGASFDWLATDDGGVALAGVDLALPDGSKLLQDLRMRIAPGERVLIRGPSGSGKSTLFRALAGIWPFGRGSISVADAERSLFLPQRPYMPLGTLKRATCFPGRESDFADDTVRAALRDVGLDHLVGELATVDHWERRLSGGEQQRLAASRALLLQPAWCFLDEATSALDRNAQVELYELLLRRLPNAAFVSIAHRTELEGLHPRVLTIDGGRILDSAARG